MRGSCVHVAMQSSNLEAFCHYCDAVPRGRQCTRTLFRTQSSDVRQRIVSDQKGRAKQTRVIERDITLLPVSLCSHSQGLPLSIHLRTLPKKGRAGAPRNEPEF